MINDVVGRRCTTNGRMAQLVEHIVHIDGVTGSSPVATTTVRPKTQFLDGYFMPSIQKSPVQSPKSRKKEGLPPEIQRKAARMGLIPAAQNPPRVNASAPNASHTSENSESSSAPNIPDDFSDIYDRFRTV